MILSKTHLQRCITFFTERRSQGPLFSVSYNVFHFNMVKLVAQNGGGAESRDGARGLVGAGAPELNNVS